MKAGLYPADGIFNVEMIAEILTPKSSDAVFLRFAEASSF